MGKRNKQKRQSHKEPVELSYTFTPKDIEILFLALDEAPLQKIKQWGFSGEEIIALRNRIKEISEDVLFEQHPGVINYDDLD